MRAASLRARTRRALRGPLPRAEHDALLARIKAHKQRLEDYRARLQAAERLLAELVKSEARLTELD